MKQQDKSPALKGILKQRTSIREQEFPEMIKSLTNIKIGKCQKEIIDINSSPVINFCEKRQQTCPKVEQYQKQTICLKDVSGMKQIMKMNSKCGTHIPEQFTKKTLPAPFWISWNANIQVGKEAINKYRKVVQQTKTKSNRLRENLPAVCRVKGMLVPKKKIIKCNGLKTVVQYMTDRKSLITQMNLIQNININPQPI